MYQRKIYLNAAYVLDQGRGNRVTVVATTDQMVVFLDHYLGHECAMSIKDFRPQAWLPPLWAPNHYVWGCLNSAAQLVPKGFITDIEGINPHNWCIDLSKVSDDAYTQEAAE